MIARFVLYDDFFKLKDPTLDPSVTLRNSYSGMATAILHEIWHIQGGGQAVDQDSHQNDNLAIMTACGTGAVSLK